MRKSDHEKAEIRRQTEARRQPEKDRAAHDRGRGKKLPSLSDLSREMPSDEVVANFIGLITEESSDRSAAIMAAGFLEQALFTAIGSRIVDPGPESLIAWFSSANAPFGTFAAKIKLGRALAIYGPKTEERLALIKDIRNVFAHRSSPIDFGHPTLIKEVKRLSDQDMIGSNPVRTRFAASCLALAKALVLDAEEHGGKELQVSLP